MFLRQLAAGCADLLWPPVCAACARETDPMAALCRVCADPLVSTCRFSEALSLPYPAAWTHARCAFDYGGQLAIAILRAKHSPTGAYARLLGRLLTLPHDPVDFVVPVPLHSS